MAGEYTVTNTETGYVVSVEDFEGDISFTFDDIEERSRDLTCQLTIQRQFPGENPESFTERVNILSASAKDGVKRSLNELWESPRGFWTGRLNKATEAMRIAHMERDWSIDLTKREARPGARYLLDGLILDGAVQTILFGAGGTGKTMLALTWALSITDGIPEFGYMGEPGDVLFVDYEADEDQIGDRLEQLKQGLGYGRIEKFHYWPGRGSFANSVPALKRKVKQGVRFVVVDSAGLAVGGSPLDEQITLAYCSAARSLGVPVLTLAHVTKAGEDKYPFGSIMWSNAARATINVKAPEDNDGLVKHMGLFFRKMNNAAMNRNGMGFAMSFAEDDSWATVQREDMHHDISSWQPLRLRLGGLLRGGARFTIKDFSLETGEKENTIYHALKRMPEVLNEGGRGRATEYFVPAFISDKSDV